MWPDFETNLGADFDIFRDAILTYKIDLKFIIIFITNDKRQTIIATLRMRRSVFANPIPGVGTPFAEAQEASRKKRLDLFKETMSNPFNFTIEQLQREKDFELKMAEYEKRPIPTQEERMLLRARKELRDEFDKEQLNALKNSMRAEQMAKFRAELKAISSQ